MSEYREELEGELSSLNNEIHEWESLMNSSGWNRLKGFLEEQKRMRSGVVMSSPITNEHTTYAQEMFKGEYRGMLIAMETPLTQLEQAKNRREVLLKELDNETELERRVAAVGGSRLDGSPYGE